MSRVFVFSLIIMLFLNSCKTVSVNQESQKITKTPVILSSIGLEKDNVIQSGFGNTAIPEYSKPIRVMATSVAFNNKTHKAYVEAAKNQQKPANIAYVDSLPNKPRFISLRIADHVNLISELNAKHNNNVKEYLTNKDNAIVVTNISMVLTPQETADITNAETIFLAQNGTKDYALQLQTSNKTTKTVTFNSGVVFAYRTSSACWQEDSKYKLNIVDLVDGYRSCPDKTYRSAKRAKKRVNYFKL